MNSTLQRIITRIGVFALALSIFIAPAFCQNISGSLTGTVKDSAGAVIPRAEVKLTVPLRKV